MCIRDSSKGNAYSYEHVETFELHGRSLYKLKRTTADVFILTRVIGAERIAHVQTEKNPDGTTILSGSGYATTTYGPDDQVRACDFKLLVMKELVKANIMTRQQRLLLKKDCLTVFPKVLLKAREAPCASWKSKPRKSAKVAKGTTSAPSPGTTSAPSPGAMP